MYLKEIVTVSYRSIRANKMRSFLTILGIIIGVASVIGMISTGEGVQTAITNMIKSRGANLLYVRKQHRGRRRVKSGTGGRLFNRDVIELRKNSNHLKFVSPEMGRGQQVVYQKNNLNSYIQGVSHFWSRMYNWKVVEGRFFQVQEDRGKLRVAVIGASIKRDLFGNRSCIGKQIKIKKTPFVVIGVLEKKGSGGWRDRDKIVVVPFKTAQSRLFGKGNMVDYINIQVKDDVNMQLAEEEVTDILRKAHRLHPHEDNDFRIYNQADFIEMRSKTTKTLTMLIAGIATISLIVGGIGIMNIMLVSVTERTKEIGLRKAVGARNRDIMVQFLVEAIMLTLLGGIIGVMLGFGFAFILSKVSIFDGLTWDLQVPMYSIVLAFGFSTVIGIFSGFYPARKASLMNPINALRSD